MHTFQEEMTLKAVEAVKMTLDEIALPTRSLKPTRSHTADPGQQNDPRSMDPSPTFCILDPGSGGPWCAWIPPYLVQMMMNQMTIAEGQWDR